MFVFVYDGNVVSFCSVTLCGGCGLKYYNKPQKHRDNHVSPSTEKQDMNLETFSAETENNLKN